VKHNKNKLAAIESHLNFPQDFGHGRFVSRKMIMKVEPHIKQVNLLSKNSWIFCENSIYRVMNDAKKKNFF
jgi:hypothetical protein